MSTSPVARARASAVSTSLSTSGPPNSLIWIARIGARLAAAREPCGRPYSAAAADELTVVGSIAFDAVKTPFGERERMLGGAAVHFALAASFFDEVRVVGPGRRRLRRGGARGAARPRRRSPTTSSASPGGKTFFWRGDYGWDLTRATRSTRSSTCSRTSSRSCPRRSRASDVLFLANIQPDLQRDVRDAVRRTRASSRSTR